LFSRKNPLRWKRVLVRKKLLGIAGRQSLELNLYHYWENHWSTFCLLKEELADDFTDLIAEVFPIK
jgi:hypothetical protein